MPKPRMSTTAEARNAFREAYWGAFNYTILFYSKHLFSWKESGKKDFNTKHELEEEFFPRARLGGGGRDLTYDDITNRNHLITVHLQISLLLAI